LFKISRLIRKYVRQSFPIWVPLNPLGSSNCLQGSVRILKLTLFWVSRFRQRLNNVLKVSWLEKGWKTLMYGNLLCYIIKLGHNVKNITNLYKKTYSKWTFKYFPTSLRPKRLRVLQRPWLDNISVASVVFRIWLSDNVDITTTNTIRW